MIGTQTYYLSPRILSRLFMFAGILLIFLFSCTSRKENPLLLHADSLMTDYPDSALIMLESIPFPQKLSTGDRALYALLLTQARHKNFIDLDDDSLIKVAVDYYGDKSKCLRAAQAHYYYGATYRDKGNVPFAVEEYLKAIDLMPEENEFLAMIYDNLAECYLDEDLYDVAMEVYKKAYEILKNDKGQAHYPLRGMGNVYLLQSQLDSALCYYQKAVECASVSQDSSSLQLFYNDLATVYFKKKDYNKTNNFVSKVIAMSYSDNLNDAYLLKGRVMLDMNELDSASFYFGLCKDKLDIFGKAVCYSELWEVEKKKENWKAAVQNADAYLNLYDSIQVLSQSRELDKLINNYQLDVYKRTLSQRERFLIISVVAVFFILVIAGIFLFLWNDSQRKKYYITLQQQLMQNRVNVMSLKEGSVPPLEEIKVDKLAELREEQLQLCISMFKTTECYGKLQTMIKATPRQLKSMHPNVLDINVTIRKTFIDVMANLKDCCPALTNDDLFYCVLSLLHCPNSIIMELMGISTDALKMRKSRIKAKLELELFEYIFCSDNQ